MNHTLQAERVILGLPPAFETSKPTPSDTHASSAMSHLLVLPKGFINWEFSMQIYKPVEAIFIKPSHTVIVIPMFVPGYCLLELFRVAGKCSFAGCTAVCLFTRGQAWGMLPVLTVLNKTAMDSQGTPLGTCILPSLV